MFAESVQNIGIMVDVSKAENLVKMAETLQEMSVWVMHFDGAFRKFARLRQYSQTDFMMMHYDHEKVQATADEVSTKLLEARQNIMRREHDVTTFLNATGIPSVWKVYPPRAIGGPINIFDAFIDLNGVDSDARPNLIQITDILEKALLACQRQQRHLEENPSHAVIDTVKAVPMRAGKTLSWLFPTEKQRATLGWLIIAVLVAIVLRYLFGVHIEDAGKLLIKWFRL